MEDYDLCDLYSARTGNETGLHHPGIVLDLFSAANQTMSSTTMYFVHDQGGIEDHPSSSVEEFKYYFNSYLNPIICSFGLLGNLLNIIVLTRRRMQAAMDSSMERMARYNLIALALSDMFYCAVTFPRAFLSQQIIHQSHELPQLYLRAYGLALQSVFKYTSTWLTVILAVGRYAAICRPIETRYLSDIKFTVVGIVAAFVLCAAFRLPLFWTFRIHRTDCSSVLQVDEQNDHIYYILDQGSFVKHEKLKTAFTYAWFIGGYLVPVALLFYCNAHLVHALRESQRMRALYRVNPKAPVTFSWRVTSTLIAIVCMFIVLVSPSEILHFYYYTIGRDAVENFNLAIVVTNVMLTGNFGCNFVLYCAVNAHFRNTWCHCLKCAVHERRHHRCKKRYTFTRSTPGSYRRSCAIIHQAACDRGGGGGVAGAIIVDARDGAVCQTYIELARVDTVTSQKVSCSMPIAEEC